MSEGNAGVSRIPGKHGTAPAAFAKMTVLVDDTPGTLARLLAEIGELGANLEDVWSTRRVPRWVWLKSRSIRLFMRRWSAICRLAVGVL